MKENIKGKKLENVLIFPSLAHCVCIYIQYYTIKKLRSYIKITYNFLKIKIYPKK